MSWKGGNVCPGGFWFELTVLRILCNSFFFVYGGRFPLNNSFESGDRQMRSVRCKNNEWLPFMTVCL